MNQKQPDQHTFKPPLPPEEPVFQNPEDILGASISKQEAVSLIQADAEAWRIFSKFPLYEQERLTAFIQGARGIRITYDSFFKHIMNPGTHPSRLENFLTALLGEKSKIRQVLPLEGVQMTDAGSFVIMDIAVELQSGTMVNVEIQKIGYLFPGERASCYISDFIMRQYNRVKDERGRHFSFRDLKPVILIVIMENSSEPFKAVFPKYIHKEITTFDSGAQIPSLSSAVYISLDTFHNVVHNINTELDAWLEFLSTDDPAGIVRLVNAYPQFLSCYQDIKDFRKKPGELIYMYSEALAILDRNTEIYMCEELKKENAALKKELDDLRCAVSENKTILSEIKTALSEKETALSEKETALLEKETALLKKETALSEKETALSEIKTVLQQKDKEIALLRQKFEDASQ